VRRRNGIGARSGLGWSAKTSFSYFLTIVWAVTVAGMSVNVNILEVSVVDLAAPKPPSHSQVAISCSGRVSIPGSI